MRVFSFFFVLHVFMLYFNLLNNSELKYKYRVCHSLYGHKLNYTAIRIPPFISRLRYIRKNTSQSLLTTAAETSDLCIINNLKDKAMGFNDDLKDWMQIWFEQCMKRFDRIDRYLEKMAIKEKLLEGERLLDNQDVCQMLNVSKRTLQRYRSSGELPYHKTFYKESDVEAFIKANFAKGENTGNDAPEDTGGDPEDTDS